MTLWTIFCRFTGLSVLTGNHRWYSEAYGGWEMDSVREVDVVTACFLLMPHGLWRELAGFDEAFFMYVEEADLCMRAGAQYGARPAFTPDAVIIHYGEASEKVKTDKVIKLTLMDKHFRGARRWLARQFLIGVPLTRHPSSGLAAVLSGARFTALARFLDRGMDAALGVDELSATGRAWRQVRPCARSEAPRNG